MTSDEGGTLPESAILPSGAWEAAPVPMVILLPCVDDDGRTYDFGVHRANRGARELLGVNCLERQLSSLVPPMDGVAIIARLTHLVEHGSRAPERAKPLEVCLSIGGESRYFAVRAELLERGVVASFIDVSEERAQRTEHAQRLAEEQEIYRATFRDAPVGVAHLDLAGRFIEVNRRLEEVLGYSREELLSMSFSDLKTPPGEEPEPIDWEPSEVEGQARSRTQRRYLRKDGSVIWTQLTASPVRDRSGLLQRYIAIVEDVSGLARANERLEESSRSKDEFLAVLGHELRNPLTALRHASVLLSEPGDHDLARVVRIIERQTKHMGRLVDDLLDVGRIARGKFDFRVEQVDVRQIVSFALDDLEAGSLLSQRLEVDLVPGPLWIQGDSARLLQAVQNLLNNAVKYTPSDGHILVRLEKGDGVLRFSVKDSGVGLEESFAKKLFLPFEQEPQDLSRSQGGLGLGLALTSQIVKHHGGTISAESPGRGQGATFVVELPYAAVEKVDSAPPEPRTTRQLKFLVVEDNRDAAELLEMLLTARGHDVTLCFSGDRAVDAALGQVPDVILCDLGLPGLSGFEVAEKIREQPTLEHTVLLALSGYGRPEDLERCEAVGFSAHLTKPADVNEIFARLDDHLEAEEEGHSLSVTML